MDSFHTKSTLRAGDKEYEIFNPARLPQTTFLPYSLKILLENLLRHEDGDTVTCSRVAGTTAARERSRTAPRAC